MTIYQQHNIINNINMFNSRGHASQTNIIIRYNPNTKTVHDNISSVHNMHISISDHISIKYNINNTQGNGTDPTAMHMETLP